MFLTIRAANKPYPEDHEIICNANLAEIVENATQNIGKNAPTLKRWTTEAKFGRRQLVLTQVTAEPFRQKGTYDVIIEFSPDDIKTMFSLMFGDAPLSSVISSGVDLTNNKQIVDLKWKEVLG